jgi:hypothetical protein
VDVGPSGEVVHARGGFAVRIPPGWSAAAGGDWLLARSPGRDLAVEVMSFPSVRSPRDVAGRARRLLERQRRLRAEVTGERAQPIAGLESHTLLAEFVARGREVRVRATWVRLDGRLARVMGVAELTAQWREPESIASVESSLRRATSGAGP